MRISLALFFFLLAVQSFGQNLDVVKNNVEILTDSTFDGRGYVNDGSNKAAEFLAAVFFELGLEPIEETYFQPFSFEVNTFPNAVVVSSQAQNFVAGRDYIVNPNSGVASGKYKTVYLDSTHFNGNVIPEIGKKYVPVVDKLGIDTPDEVAALHTFKTNQLNASPVVLLNPGKTTWSVGTRQFEYAEVEIDARSITSKIEKIEFEIAPVQITYNAKNVIGKIAGKRSDSCIVITAHFDHLGRMGSAMFPGASDNASGTATMLDLAAHYAKAQPAFDTYIIGFAAEEAGLIGSKYFVDHPLFPLDKIVLLINLDLMGSAAKGITVVNGKLYPDKMRTLAKINNAEDLLPKIKLRGKAANSDHYWFSERGVPSIFIYTEGNAKAYHDVNDVPTGLDWANYNEVFTLLTKFISQL